MAKIDEVKEHIGVLKSYLNIVIALILAIGAGISKLYTSDDINSLFWIGIIFIVLLIVIFLVIAKNIHLNIKKLKDL